MTVLATKAGEFPLTKSWPLSGLDYGGYSSGSYPSELLSFGNKTYMELYRSQRWVYIAVNKIARAIARLPLKSYRLDATGDRQRLRDHPLPILLKSPSRFGMRYRLIEDIATSVLVFGNALVIKERAGSGRAPSELWLAPWNHITVVPGEEQPISGYLYNGTKKQRVFLPEEVMHFRFFAPDGRVGVSPLEPLAQTLALEDAAVRHTTASFKNGVRPSAVVSTAQRLNDGQVSQLRSQLKSTLEGGDKAFGVAVMHSGLELKEWSFNAQESEIVKLREINREEVAACYGIDPTQIGILARATFSNVEEAHRGFYMDTLGPPVTMIEDTFAMQLIAPEQAFAGTFVEFDMADVLKGNLETRFHAYGEGLNSGWISRNEIRARENLAAVDDRGADALYAPMNMVALDGRIPSNSQTPVGTPPTKGEETHNS